MPSIVRSYTNDSNVPIVVGGIQLANSQTVNAGDLLEINGTSRTAEVGVAASTTLFGIANQSATTATATASDVISATLLRGQVVRMNVYQGGVKKTFAQTDMYTTAFDLHDQTSVDPNDTTGGMCYVVGYDNTANTVDVIFALANLASVG